MFRGAGRYVQWNTDDTQLFVVSLHCGCALIEGERSLIYYMYKVL